MHVCICRYVRAYTQHYCDHFLHMTVTSYVKLILGSLKVLYHFNNESLVVDFLDIQWTNYTCTLLARAVSTADVYQVKYMYVVIFLEGIANSLLLNPIWKKFIKQMASHWGPDRQNML